VLKHTPFTLTLQDGTIKRNGWYVVKKCKECHEEKDYQEFDKVKGNKDGYCGFCKKCRQRKTNLRREKNPEKYRAKVNAYRKKNAEERRKAEKEYREKNREKIRKRDRIRYFLRTEEDRLKANERVRKYRKTEHGKRKIKEYVEKNREKSMVRWKTNNAIRDGKLQKAEKCTVCLSSEDIEAHHPDYEKPLQVVWLCKRCHMKIHKGETNGN